MYTVRLLRFLQLLCENHNPHLQNHLRQQRTSEGVLMGKSFDFIVQFSLMLGTYIKAFNASNANLGMQLIDTLVEVVQGPCREN